MNWFICPQGGSEVSWKHKISSSSLTPDRKVSRDWTHDSGSPGEQKSLFCQLCCDGHLLQNINLNLSLNRAHINEADGSRSEDKRVIFHTDVFRYRSISLTAACLRLTDAPSSAEADKSVSTWSHGACCAFWSPCKDKVRAAASSQACPAAHMLLLCVRCSSSITGS